MKTRVEQRRSECVAIDRARFAELQGLVAAAAFALGPGAVGALFIDVGNFPVLPDTPGQVLDLYVVNTGPDPVSVAGLSFNVQINDSGPGDRGGLGGIPGPSITKVDILTDTLFGANNTGQVNGQGALQFANARTTTSSGTVSIGVGNPILLGRIEIDTTGFFSPETWELRLGNTVNGPSRFFLWGGDALIPMITDGMITAVPEPGWAATTFSLGALIYAATRARRSS